MFKKQNYINFSEIVFLVLKLEELNRMININKLKRNVNIQSEIIQEFISTNNIEGDKISFANAKLFLKEELSNTALQKRWIGIKYSSNVIWSKKYNLNIDYINEAHRSLLRHVETPGGVWKTKLNQVGSLITSHPEDVPKLMINLLINYQSIKLSEEFSVFSIIPFISEFLAIHPYEDGNGRMSRLLMNRELYDAGYKFTKYISVSKFLWDTKDEYIDALESRNIPWASNSLSPQDLIPLFKVILNALIKAATKALTITKLIKYSKNAFQIKVVDILIEPMSISNIIKEMKIANSKSSINKWLKELVNENKINLIGNLKSSKYANQ